MAAEQPYNSLGQILSSGGDVFAALKSARGMEEGALIDLFRERFRPEDDTIIGIVLGIAYAGRSAAAALNAAGPTAPIASINVPINPYMNQGNYAQGRYFAVTEYSFEESGEVRDLRLDIPDIVDWQQVYESAGLEAQSRARGCYKDLKFDNPDSVPIPDLHFIYIVKAF